MINIRPPSQLATHTRLAQRSQNAEHISLFIKYKDRSLNYMLGENQNYTHPINLSSPKTVFV